MNFDLPESEETEMKDIEWLKEHITIILGGKVKYKDKNVIDDKYFVGLNNAYVAVLEMLESLDVETLTPEWIDELIHYSTDQDAFGNIVRIEIVPAKYLRNLLVPKQELPVIPKFVADWIKKAKRYHSISWLLNYENIKGWSHELTLWCFESGNDDNLHKLARAWLDGYRVEEEQKYRVIFPSVDENGKGFNYLAKDTYHNELWVEDSRTDGLDWEERSSFTEDEIRDLDKGDILFEHFAVKVEELEE